MRLDEVTANGVTGAGRAIVGALGAGVAVGGPAQGPLGPGVQHGVLLLDAEPGLLALGLLHRRSARMAGVGGDGLGLGHGAVGVDAGGLVGVAHHQDVVTAAEGVAVDGAGDEVHLGVVAGGLAGGGTIVVPGGEVLGLGGDLVEDPGGEGRKGERNVRGLGQGRGQGDPMRVANPSLGTAIAATTGGLCLIRTWSWSEGQRLCKEKDRGF